MANGGSAKGAQWDFTQNGSLDAGDTHAGLSFAGRKTAQGQPGAPKIIGNRLFTSLTDKVGTAKVDIPAVADDDGNPGTACCPSSSSSTSGRISWIELRPKETD